jgi:hypothetical protein
MPFIPALVKAYPIETKALVIDELTGSRDGFEFDNRLLQAKVQGIKVKLKTLYDNFNEYHAEGEHEFELAEAKSDQAEVISMLGDKKAVLQVHIQEVPQGQLFGSCN